MNSSKKFWILLIVLMITILFVTGILLISKLPKMNDLPELRSAPTIEIDGKEIKKEIENSPAVHEVILKHTHQFQTALQQKEPMTSPTILPNNFLFDDPNPEQMVVISLIGYKFYIEAPLKNITVYSNGMIQAILTKNNEKLTLFGSYIIQSSTEYHRTHK